MPKKQVTPTRKLYWLHPHFYNWMGGHKYILEVIERLKRDHGFEVILITSGLKPEAQERFKKLNVPIIKLFGLSTNNPLYWLGLPLMLKLEKWYLVSIKKIDLQAGFISSMFPANSLAASLSARTAQLCYEPFAFFYDENFVAGFPAHYRLFARLIKNWYQALDAQSVRANRVIFTLSEFNRRWIKRAYGVSSQPVYEGVNLDFFKRRVSSKLRIKYRGKKLIFHATDYTPIKGTVFLIKALPAVLKKVPQAHVVISETLPDSPMKKEVLSLIEQLGLTQHVEFGGFLPYELLPEYLSLAQVVVQPSINQSMNLTVKEAMSCQTPIITSPEGKEQTKNGEAGFLVDPHRTNLLAKKIITCLTDAKKRRDMGKKGRQIIKKKFSWESVTQKISTSLEKSLYV